MLRFIRFFFLGLLLTGLSPALRAQDVHFEADAPRMIAVGEAFRIEFSLNAKPEEFTPPAFGDFDVIAGPSTSQGQSVSIVNGKVSQSINFTYTYVIRARAAGTFTVGAARVKVAGKEYSSQALPIEAVAADAMQQPSGQGASPSAQGGAQGSAPARTASIGAEDLLVRVSVNRNRVFKGQPVKAVFKIYSRVPLAGIEAINYPAFNGFWAQDLNVDGYSWQRETLGGRVYDARVIKETLLYPQQSGTLYIEQFSLTAVAQIMVQSAARNSLFDDFFGGGPQVQEERKSLSAPPIQITVEEFPAGAPANFSGAVGQFQMTASLGSNSLSANTSDTYLLKISGNGNLPLIQAPKLSLPTSFEQYNMKTTESLNHSSMGIAGYRQFEYPFIPRGEGNYEIAPVQFSYFDPEKKQYVTLSTPAFPITVTADSTSVGGAGMVSGVSKEELKILDKDIRFIRTGRPEWNKRGAVWFGSLGYWGVLLAILLSAAGCYAYLKKQLRDRKNTTLVRTRKANKVALQRLKAALGHMEAGNERSFYEELLKALWGYMSDKLNIPVANLTKDNIREGLLRQGVSAEPIERFVQLISDCEYAQYSPSSSGHMNEIYNAAVKMLSKFESAIKK